MIFELNQEHINLLQDIARQVVEMQDIGAVDTGPGGEDRESVARELHRINDILSYWLGEYQ